MKEVKKVPRTEEEINAWITKHEARAVGNVLSVDSFYVTDVLVESAKDFQRMKDALEGCEQILKTLNYPETAGNIRAILNDLK